MSRKFLSLSIERRWSKKFSVVRVITAGMGHWGIPSEFELMIISPIISEILLLCDDYVFFQK